MVQVPVEILRFSLLEVDDLCMASPHLERPIGIVARGTGGQNGTQLPFSPIRTSAMSLAIATRADATSSTAMLNPCMMGGRSMIFCAVARS